MLAPMHECNTTKAELTQYLEAREILCPNSTYDFHFVHGKCHMSDNIEGFILPLFLLEVGFNLPLHSFFCLVPNEYRSSSPSPTSCTFLPTPENNMDALVLLDSIHKNEGITMAPPRTMADTSQKRPRVEGSTQDVEVSEHPQLAHRKLRREPTPLRVTTPLAPAPTSNPIAPVKFTNSINSLVYVTDPPVATFVSDTTLLSQLEALLVSYSLSKTHEEAISHIKELNSFALSLKAKYEDLEILIKQIKEENSQLKARVSFGEEKLKSQDQQHLSELECLRQCNKEALKKYQKDTKKYSGRGIAHTMIQSGPSRPSYYRSSQPDSSELKQPITPYTQSGHLTRAIKY
ncbi:hypothetical protein PVK06_026993 [Gossypium arboreum]|uniref:Uncharacterized protein n=1 Tax=Gossypium arboreum TaxID=29729 RepID=A0ABR0NZ31_GOSAR|nr:hypothetical protein PVK06_026993 [Gossypium arboreum]